LIIRGVTVRGVTRPLPASTSCFPSPVDQAVTDQSNRDRLLQRVQAFAYRAIWKI
jgi:hypothetical protein